MNHLRLTLMAIAFAALAVPASALAQGSTFTVDATLARRGKAVWANTGCMICHGINHGRSAGPDLAGLYERRTAEWVKRFIKNTSEMLETDSIAIALLNDFKKIKMPNVKLSDRDIDAVMHFIAQEDAATR